MKKLFVLFFIHRSQIVPPENEFVRELYEVCDPEAASRARCGTGASCLIQGGVPTCHCIRDEATGIRLAGNPYRGCTWDISGVWEIKIQDNDSKHDYSNGLTNEKYVIEIKRTDAVLKTRYMTGNIFIVSPVTITTAGYCSRAFVDVNDNQSVLFEAAEGFLDGEGRSMFFKSRISHQSLNKIIPKKTCAKDAADLSGGWKKSDGSKIKIYDFNRSQYNNFMISQGNAYWYNDDSLGAPQLRLSMSLFVDQTLDFEKIQFQTNDRFIQLGWYGMIMKGVNSINIISPADGMGILQLEKISHNPIYKPLNLPTTSLQLNTIEEIEAIKKSAEAALENTKIIVENQYFDLNNRLNDITNTRLPKNLITESFDMDLYDTKRELDSVYMANDPNQTFSIDNRKLNALSDTITFIDIAKTNLKQLNQVNNNIFKPTNFFQSEEDANSPYSYAWRRPAERLDTIENKRNAELQRIVNKNSKKNSKHR